MASNRFLQTLNQISEKLTFWLHCIGVSFLLIMVFLTTVDVTFRYLFNNPMPGTYELMEYMMVILVAFSLAHTASTGGHIKITLLVDRFPVPIQCIINCLTSLGSFTLFFFITWVSGVYAVQKTGSGLESSVLHIPVYPFIWVVSIGSGLLCLVFLIEFINTIAKGFQK